MGIICFSIKTGFNKTGAKTNILEPVVRKLVLIK
jgi:hypothetical protein